MDEKQVEELAELMIAIENKWSDESAFGPGSLDIYDMLRHQAIELIKAGYKKSPSVKLPHKRTPNKEDIIVVLNNFIEKMETKNMLIQIIDFNRLEEVADAIHSLMEKEP